MRLAKGRIHLNTFNFQLATRFTVDVSCDCVLGLEAKSFENTQFMNDASSIFAVSTNFKLKTILNNLLPAIGAMIPSPMLNPEGLSWFKGVANQAIDTRRQNQLKRDDFLNYFLELKKKKELSVEATAGYLFGVFVDSFETASYFLSGFIGLLAAHPECQDRLRDEIRSCGETADLEQISQLPYLDKSLHGKLELNSLNLEMIKTTSSLRIESLRATEFPFPLWKNCEESIEVEDYDGSVLKIEEGTEVLIATLSYHHHPDFYPNPKEFKPERFDESHGGAQRFKDAGVWLPFGAGPRMCPGDLAVFSISRRISLIGIYFYRRSTRNNDDEISRFRVGQELQNVPRANRQR